MVLSGGLLTVEKAPVIKSCITSPQHQAANRAMALVHLFTRDMQFMEVD